MPTPLPLQPQLQLRLLAVVTLPAALGRLARDVLPLQELCSTQSRAEPPRAGDCGALRREKSQPGTRASHPALFLSRLTQGRGGLPKAQPCLGPSLTARAADTTQTTVLIAETAQSSAFCPELPIVILMHAHTDTSKEPFSFQAVLLC